MRLFQLYETLWLLSGIKLIIEYPHAVCKNNKIEWNDIFYI